MFQFIYCEESVRSHPIAQEICRRFSKIPIIPCEKYGEVFNRQSQNFRLQKSNPSLILAKKTGNLVLSTPKGYGIGGARNFYYSHLLNCPFDCRYCFLQGLYSSANFVLFVNYEDFAKSILEKIEECPAEKSYFFSGYDADSLALEPVTQFLKYFLPFFSHQQNAVVELRTKSVNINPLLNTPPFKNCVIAFTLTPKEISAALEHKTPSISRRLEAIGKLQDLGWSIGLRFDPLIYCDDFEEKYLELFNEVFNVVRLESLHSVSIGPFRLPKGIYKNVSDLYPEEKIFSHSLAQRGPFVSYSQSIEKNLVAFCETELLKRIPEEKLFITNLGRQAAA